MTAREYSLATRDFFEESVPHQPISVGARRPTAMYRNLAAIT
jgi:hypothetical protein